MYHVERLRFYERKAASRLKDAAVPHAHAEGLTFNPKVTIPAFSLPRPGFWKLTGGTPHQQAVIIRCQEKLLAKGVTDKEALKYGCSIYLAENERMDPLRLGDGGRAFGICQRNLGNRVWAKDFLAKHPEWKTLETQLEYCTSRFAAAWFKYGNVFQATVEHNCPACARKKKDACHISPCYSVRVKNATSLLSL